MGTKYFAKLTLILFAITAVVAALLGTVNYVTKDRIAEIKVQKTATAMQSVIPGATSFEELTYSGTDAIVKAVYAAKDGGKVVGHVVKVSPAGFGGAIDMVVGIDGNGKVSGVSIISMTETSGLGANASQESFRNQFIGKIGTLAVTKDGGNIDALTGATITSRAVTKGVNSALEAAKALG